MLKPDLILQICELDRPIPKGRNKNDCFNKINGLISVFTTGRFSKSLVSNSKGPIKCLTLSNQPCQIDQHLLISTLMKLFFIHLLVVLISAVKVATLLMILMLEFVFQIK